MKDLCNLLVRVVLSFSLIFSQSSLANLSPITPDGHTNTTTDISSEHNIPVVNIAKPSDGGVSYNTYTDFNVDANGAIINNSTQIGTTNLGGQLYANPNFGTGNAAGVILNEVTTNNTSTLQGPTEIFGQKAEFILANPNGITCNGCGFINTSRLGLITGTPQLDSNGNIQNFTMPSGTGFVKLVGDSANQLIALNASNVDYVDIISNVVEITGKVYANQQLNTQTGNQSYDYATRQVSSNNNSLTGQISIDARNFGAMQAGKIELVASQLGVGVNLENGVITASNGDLIINSDGILTNSATVQAVQNVDISSDSVQNSSEIISGNNTQISAQTLANTGQITANNNLNLIANSGVTNSGSLVGVNNASITSQNDVINSGKILALNTINITSQNLQNNQGTIGYISQDGLTKTQNLNLNANTITNNNSQIVSENLTISAQQLTNTNSTSQPAGIFANSFNLTNLQAFDNSTGYLYSSSDIAIKNLTNTSGTVISSGGLNITNSIDLDNSAGILSSQNAMNINLTNHNLINSGTIQSQSNINISNANSLSNQGDIVGNDLIISSQTLINTGNIGSSNNMSLASNTINNSGQITSLNNATISANDLTNSSSISAQNGLNITATNSINNNGKLIGGQSTITNQGLSAIQNLAGEISGVNSLNISSNAGLILDSSSKITSNGSANINLGSSDFTANGSISAGDLAMQAGNFTNQTTISANNFLNLTTQNLTNNSKIYSLGTMEISSQTLVNSGQIASLDDLLFTTQSFTNSQNSSIYSGGNLTVNADNILNDNAEIYASQTLGLQGSNSVTNQMGRIESQGDLSILTQNFLNKGNVQTAINPVWTKVYEEKLQRTDTPESDTASIYLDTSAIVSNASPALVLSGGNMSIIADNFTNDASTISAGKNLQITSQNAVNTSYFDRYLLQDIYRHDDWGYGDRYWTDAQKLCTKTQRKPPQMSSK